MFETFNAFIASGMSEGIVALAARGRVFDFLFGGCSHRSPHAISQCCHRLPTIHPKSNGQSPHKEVAGLEATSLVLPKKPEELSRRIV